MPNRVEAEGANGVWWLPPCEAPPRPREFLLDNSNTLQPSVCNAQAGCRSGGKGVHATATACASSPIPNRWMMIHRMYFTTSQNSPFLDHKRLASRLAQST